ncbi:MAG TPA: oligosaccharide flippase family protein [Ignavibacteriaceae bacterium]|nr:oligosaccharide flippase family protein [Ignavibacteriaceae bacterium]
MGKYTFYNALLEKITFFILYAFLARHLEKELYGNVILVFTFSSIVYSFFELGLNSYFQRELTYKNVKTGLKIDQAIILRIISFILYISINFIYLIPKTNISFFSVLIILILVFLLNINTFFSNIFYGLSDFKTPFKSLFTARIIFIAFFLVSIIFSPGLEIIISSLFISVICQCVLNIKYLKVSGVKVRIYKINPTLIKSILKSSLPMGIGVIFVWLYNKSDIILIQQMVGFKEVAEYAVAYSIYQLSIFFPGIFLVPLFSELSFEFNKNKFINFKYVYNTAIYLILISFLIIIVLLLIGDKIILIVYGKEYLLSKNILYYLIIAIPGLFLNNLTGVTLNSIHKEKLVMISTFFAFLINIIFNLIYIPKIGITAAIISTILAEYSALFIQLIFVYYAQKELACKI